MTTDLPWHQNPDNVIELARHLESTCQISTADDAIDYFEKPWDWTDWWTELQADETDPYVDRTYTIGSGDQAECDAAHDRLAEFIGDDESPNMDASTSASRTNPRAFVVSARKSTHARLQAEFPEKIWSPYARA